MQIKDLLTQMFNSKASDLHIVSNSKPYLRIDGVLCPVGEILSCDDVKSLCFELLSQVQKDEFKKNKEIDFSTNICALGRVRASLYHIDSGNLAASFRAVPTVIPSLDEIKAPQVLKRLVSRENGLILVTGSTGSGKSTTLAAMLNEINLNHKKHIVTIEDPVEFMHQNANSLFSHRNIGTDANSYSRALKYAMRQDPDVILIGEIRDRDTMSAAITAAETGHLVLATLHTNSAIGTINRIVDSFDGGEQNQIRSMLSSSLAAIISQTLVPKSGGGRLAVFEILINNAAIGNLIRENKIYQIYSQMQLNQNQTQMRTQSQAMKKAVDSGEIDRETAIRFSNDRQEILNLLGM